MQSRRQDRGLGQDFTASGIDIEGRPGGGQPAAQLSCVTPGRPLLGGPAVEPREPPAADVGGFGFGHEIVEGAHPQMLADEQEMAKRFYRTPPVPM